MRMRSLLALWVGASTRVLNDRARLSQFAIVLNWKRRHAAAPVVRNQNTLPAFIHRQVARPGPTGRLLVEQNQLPALFINAEGTYGARFLFLELAHFTNRIQKAPVRMHCQEARALGFCRQFRWTQFAGGQIESRN